MTKVTRAPRENDESTELRWTIVDSAGNVVVTHCWLCDCRVGNLNPVWVLTKPFCSTHHAHVWAELVTLGSELRKYRV